MADISETTGEYAGTALTAAGSVGKACRAFKVLGGDVTVTTTGKPALSSVVVQQGDTVLGAFTNVTFVSGSGVLIPYLTAAGH